MVATIAVSGCGRSNGPPTTDEPSSTEETDAITIKMEVLHSASGLQNQQVIAQGYVRVPSLYRETDRFTGFWAFSGTGAADVSTGTGDEFIAPFDGDGRCEAWWINGVLAVNLHPHVWDNNIELILRFDSNSRLLSGNWEYLTDAGVTAEGGLSPGNGGD